MGALIPVGGRYIILVQSIDDEQAVALAPLLKPLVQFVTIKVAVVVSNRENQIVGPLLCSLDAFEIASLLQVDLVKKNWNIK